MVSPTILKRAVTSLLRLAYGATVAFVLWMVLGHYVPGQGLTALLFIGDKPVAHAIAPLQEYRPYTYPDSSGYDGQYYAQLAMNPDLGDPDLRLAIDNLPFRARRMLISWTCWALAGGDPERALHLYCLANIVCWLALALLLLRWFPPDHWQNYLRWAGVMLAFGLIYSVRGSLLDGPSLLVIAAAVALKEREHSWWAAVALGAAGLIRESNIVAAVILLPLGCREWKVWRRALLQGLIVAAPILLWTAYLLVLFPPAAQGGARAIDWPFVSFAHRWGTALAQSLATGREPYNDRNLLCLFALTLQAGILLARIRPKDHWWRLGASMLALMAVLGPAVWEGYPISATRVLLPLALAFNILVPRHWKWLPVLLLGNLSVLCSFPVLDFTLSTKVCYTVEGAERVRTDRAGPAPQWVVRFDDNWFPAERSALQYWRWAGGDARIDIVNPLPVPVRATVRFGLKSRGSRFLAVSDCRIPLWRGTIGDTLTQVELASVTLAPGPNDWLFTATPSTPAKRSPSDRGVVFSVRDLEIEILGPATAGPPPPPPGATTAP